MEFIKHADFAAKLRRLADAVENGTHFDIQIAGEAYLCAWLLLECSIEHEREGDEEEIEFQIKWRNEN
ncbi:amphi-Trp domain-containing protein [Photobacterium leiognathi]|uniref:amphi-Trp domain-containing protein n=1 Tax=Photobacterium leiognathi TaxID=553611 RepID=UPI0027384151|nr:amphi-Trp domain-containing protein [Photobacterium leiognathi]